MTITLELWQTVVLTLLILSLVVILRRLATLIVMAVSRNWFGQNDVRTSPSAPNLLSTGSYESDSNAWDIAGCTWDMKSDTLYGPDGKPVDLTEKRSHTVPLADLNSSTLSGINPGGVSYFEVPRERSVLGLRVKKSRKKR